MSGYAADLITKNTRPLMGSLFNHVLRMDTMNIIVANYLANKRKQYIRIAKQVAHR